MSIFQDADWGDVPTWLAFGAAGLAALFTGRALKRERDRDERTVETQRRDQASRVSFQLPEPKVEPVRTWLDEYSGEYYAVDNDRRASVTGRVLNGSEYPVSKLLVRIHFGSDGLPYTGTPEVFEQRISVLPGRASTDDINASVAFSFPDGLDGVTGTFPVRAFVQFTDAAGVIWHRDHEFVLKEGPIPEGWWKAVPVETPA